ncbi:MAG TPA: DinB family protein [Pyrinomonadaceae bacterium]|nr:DinB family protein [Pyrinomonadaceae bacterium]
MNYQTVADIFSANSKFRDRLSEVLSDVSEEEAAALPDGEKWSIQQVAEHLALVDIGIGRICSKLIEASKAGGAVSDGSFSVTEAFGRRAREIAGLKVEAPDRVQPTGDVDIAESLARIEANRAVFDSLRRDLDSVDFSEPKFPHPFFGDLTAGEWLAMAGMHQHRHTRQIEKLLAKVRAGGDVQEKIPG